MLCGYNELLFVYRNPSFKIDVATLEKTFRNLQRVLHPDIVSRRQGKESAFGVDQSTNLNTAYETLRSTLSRALYLVLNLRCFCDIISYYWGLV